MITYYYYVIIINGLNYKQNIICFNFINCSEYAPVIIYNETTPLINYS